MSDTHLREWLTKGLKLFAIALGCLAAFAIFFVVWLKTGLVRVHIQRPWFFLIAWTGFLFWFVCQQLWKDVRRPRFWIGLIAVLSVHVGAFVIVLNRYPTWPPVWFMFTSMIEAPLLTTVVNRIVNAH
jgi:hypothetical protein